MSHIFNMSFSLCSAPRCSDPGDQYLRSLYLAFRPILVSLRSLRSSLSVYLAHRFPSASLHLKICCARGLELEPLRGDNKYFAQFLRRSKIFAFAIQPKVSWLSFKSQRYIPVDQSLNQIITYVERVIPLNCKIQLYQRFAGPCVLGKEGCECEGV